MAVESSVANDLDGQMQHKELELAWALHDNDGLCNLGWQNYIGLSENDEFSETWNFMHR